MRLPCRSRGYLCARWGLATASISGSFSRHSKQPRAHVSNHVCAYYIVVVKDIESSYVRGVAAVLQQGLWEEVQGGGQP